MSKQALVVWGGWEGHEPRQVAAVLADTLRRHDFEVEVSDTLDSFKDVERLKSLDLIVPVWTMGKIAGDQLNPLCEAVKSGVGIGGCHGGMCDSFREATEYQFMTGGHWVSHPGNTGVTYTVKITDPDHYITRGASDYEVTSEQYYMHVDPSNHVLATTAFPSPGADGPHVPNGRFDMPVAWTRFYGEGRVFYHSVGHNAATVEQPETLAMITRGLLWAARADE
jgi:type 1 glutamine amidotransferase